MLDVSKKKNRRKPGTCRLQDRKKGKKHGGYKYVAMIKPRRAKVTAAAKIVKFSSAEQTISLVESAPIKLPLADERRTISEMYIVMGSPPPEDWDLKDGTGTVSKIVSVLNFSKHQ